MFFMIGVTDGRKDLDYSRMVVCDACGAYGRYRVFMTYMSLLLFFIPVFKWNRKFYVESSCCGSLFQLNDEIGRRIAAGEDVEIRSEHLTPVHGRSSKKCACGYATMEDFEFCPKCGRRF